MKRILNLVLLPTLTLLFGICIGIIIRDIPKFKLIYEMKITDILQNIITLGVGIFVPFLIKKIIDDSRSIKSTILNEIDSYEEQLNNISELFNQCYTNKKITQANKENLNFLLELSDAKLDNLKEFLSEQMPNKFLIELSSITELQNATWKKLTGQSISAKKVTSIDLNLFNDVAKLRNQIHTGLNKLKAQIHKA